MNLGAFWTLLWLSLTTSSIVEGKVEDTDGLVTCGSAVKLTHMESKTSTGEEHYLNSEGKNLGSGSGQQIVTAVSSPTTINTLWWIRGPNDEERHGSEASCTQGVAQPIPCGSVIRLSHLDSLRNLHSHNVRSPLSRQQEVSAYGEGDGKGDNGDDWRVVCTGKYWERSTAVAFQHVDTQKYLGASSTVKFTHQNCGHNCPILNHLEIFARSQKDNFAMWIVEMGVHLSK